MTKPEEIRKKIVVNSEDIHISRVPKETCKEFKQWAKEEFCMDYGMALKHLWDHYKGILGNDTEAIWESIQLLESKVYHLENKDKMEKDVKKVRKMLSGKEVDKK